MIKILVGKIHLWPFYFLWSSLTLVDLLNLVGLFGQGTLFVKRVDMQIVELVKALKIGRLFIFVVSVNICNKVF